MRPTRSSLVLSIMAACAVITLFAAGQNKKPVPATESSPPSSELPQPAQETLDYSMYGSIREEATANSHILEYASALTHGIGLRRAPLI